MKFGFIIRNVADLRSNPTFKSECKSQLLYNEPVKVDNVSKGYARVRQRDGYQGWVDAKSIHFLPRLEYYQLVKKCNYQIVSPTARVHSSASLSQTLPFLFYGTRLYIVRRQKNRAFVRATDGGRFSLSLNCLSHVLRARPKKFDSRLIIKEADRFLGTPYLWGGTTPYGFDCSGLVQAVFRRFGINLPRDSKEQRKVGKKIDYADIRPGDLLFFPGHVAISTGGQGIVHASLAEGGVRRNSLKPGTVNFRKDLYEIFTEARRVIK